MLQQLCEAGFTANWVKCQFAVAQCSYLGHIVGNGKVYPGKNKVQAVENFPRTKKQVQAFLRFTGYYQHFIPNYYVLLCHWPREQYSTKYCGVINVTELLWMLCSSPVFWSPDFTWPFILQTDVSDFGVSAVLSQHDDEGQESGSSCHENSIIPLSEMNALPLNMESEPSRYIFWPDSSQYRLNTVPCDGWIDSRAGKTNANADTLSWMD